MGWINVENNCKLLYQYQFIDGSKPNERKILIKIIADEFPELPRIRIAYAVDRCIKESSSPINPNAFLSFVQRYLT